MVLENIVNDDVCQCTRLFKNAFKIKSTPEALKTSRLQRIPSMATSRCLYDTENNTDNKENSTIISSPIHCNATPKKNNCKTKCRLSLEDCDPNSQDSGYDMTDKDDKSGDSFRFTEPLAVAPRKLSMDMYLSPARSTIRSPIFNSPNTPSRLRTFSSGYESTDDGFNELIDMETLDNFALPSGISDLISGEIMNSERIMECDVATPEPPKHKSKKLRSMRRSLSFQVDRPDKSTPSNARSCLFRSPNSNSSASKLTFDERPRIMMDVSASPEICARPFKRPEPPTDCSPVLVKKCKTNSSSDESQAKTPEQKTPRSLLTRSVLSRCLSENDRHIHIKQALHRSLHFDDLTGDFSKSCALPLAEGRHHDLKSISPTTLANLLNGQYRHQVDEFHIIDCRYPYEFDGGHIIGAVNLYTKEMIERFLIHPVEEKKPEIKSEHNKRSILVFHCEFSFERGPNMSRFLRHIDRKRNHDCYPALHYPEVYLLDGGYEKFYNEYSRLCSPQGYRTMQDPKHEEDLRQFRLKSKSWQGEKASRAVHINRNNLKRLGF